MYHRIGEGGGRYAVDEATLRRQIEDLRARGYRFLTASQAAGWTPADGNACALTFDDGYADNAALADLGVPATVFVTSAPIAADVGVSADAFGGRALVAMLAARGVEIGAHGVTHRKWTTLSPDELAQELAVSKATLEEWGGKPVGVCAYPKGAVNDAVVHAAKAAYAAAFLADGAPLTSPVADPHRIPRIGVFGGASMAEFRLRTSALFAYLLPLWLQWKRSR